MTQVFLLAQAVVSMGFHPQLLRERSWAEEGVRFPRLLPSGSGMELDEGLYTAVCFTKGKPTPVRPPKISSQQEKRIPPFTREHGMSAGSEMFPEQREPYANSSAGRPSQWFAVLLRGPRSCPAGGLHGAQAANTPQ